MSSKQGDMTTGNPGRQILFFAIPMILGNIAQQLYSMADSAVVGRLVGKNALAAVGATTSVLSLIICMIIGLTMGTCIITSQAYGAGDGEMVRRIAGTAIYICLGMWVLIAILGAVISEPVLRMLNTPDEILSDARLYLLINTSTSLAPIAYNMTANIMRAMGDSKGPLYAVIVSSVLNVVLDILFVAAFHWDVAGVAWATTISQVASTIVNLYRIYKKHEILRLGREDLRLQLRIVGRVISIGVPMSVQNAVASVGLLGIQRIVNNYGTDTVAAYAAAGKIDQIALMPLSSLGLAVSTYIGQNYGKGDRERIKAGVRAGILQAILLGGILMAIVFGCARLFTQLFIEAGETAVIDVSVEYLRTVSVFYWLCGIMYIFLNVFRGMGMMKISTVASCLDPLIKLLAAIVLGQLWGRSAIWYAWPIGWLAALCIPVVFYRNGYWLRTIDKESKA